MAEVRILPPMGMVSLRALPKTKRLHMAIKAATNCAIPAPRAILFSGASAAAWMGPDEYLLFLPPESAAEVVARITQTLTPEHHLVVDVSQMRVGFELIAPDDILASLTPADLAAVPSQELRRSRLGQVAAAFWRVEGGWRILVARSNADYAFDLLSTATRNIA